MRTQNQKCRFRFIKSVLWAVLTVVCTLHAWAGPYPKSLNFDLTKQENFKAYWSRNGWKGYRPYPDYGVDKVKKAFHVSGKHHTANGFCFNSSPRVAVKAGQVLRIRVEAWGKGSIFVAPQYYVGRDWSGIGITQTQVLPKEEGQILIFDIPVTNIGGRRSDSAVLTFGGKAYTELYIRSYKVDVLTVDELKKTGPFLPAQWRVFGLIPHRDAETLNAASITSMPETLTVKGKKYSYREMKTPDGFVKMDSFYPNLKDAVWMFGYVDSPENVTATFGAGCDWWMTFFVNGKMVMDNRPDGNYRHPCSITDFKFRAQLKKGRNLVAVLFRRGGASAILRYGSAGMVAATALEQAHNENNLEAQYMSKIKWQRPRLFLTEDMIAKIRKDLASSTAAASSRKAYLETLRKRIDRQPMKIIRKPVKNSWGEINDYGVRAGQAALLWTFTGEKVYYDKALLFLEAAADWYNERFDAKKAVSWYGYSRIEALHAYDLLYNKMSAAQRKRIGNKLLRHVRTSFKSLREIIRYNGEGSSGPKSGFYGTRNIWWYAGVVFYKTGLDDGLCKELMLNGYRDHQIMFNHRLGLAGKEGGPMTQSPGYVLGDYWKQEFRFYMSWKVLTGENYADRMGSLAALPEWIYRSSIPLDRKKTNANPVLVQDFGSGDCSHFNNRYPLPISYLAQFDTYYGTRYPQYSSIARHLLTLCGKRLYDAWAPHLERGDSVAPFLYEYIQKNVSAPKLSKARYYKGLGQLYMQDKRTPDGTFILFTGGGSSVMHKHIDEGNFIIYKDGFQVMDTGARLIYSGMTLDQNYITNSKHSGNYFLRTTAHNCLLIHMPEEDFGTRNMDGKFVYQLANDGGMLRSTGSTMLEVKHHKDYTYACLDLTNMYNPQKAKNVIRQVAFVYPDVFVVYDRIHSGKAAYKKTFLCHTAAEPVINGSRYSWNNMTVTALLPEQTVLTKIGGPGKEFMINGVNYPIAPKDHANFKKRKYLYGEWRVDSSPKVEKELIHFLHVFHIGKDHGKPSVRAVKDRHVVSIPVAGGKTVTLSFRQDGKPGMEYSKK